MSEPISAVRSPRARRLASIQTQLLLILLLVSVAVTVVTGVLGYRNGTESLSHAAQDRVVEVRDSRARETERLYTVHEVAQLEGLRHEDDEPARDVAEHRLHRERHGQ